MVSGPKLTARQMVDGVKKLAEGWDYDAVSIGYPGVVLRDQPTAEPHNLGRGWVDFDYVAAFGCPVKIVNDAAMQAMGGFRGGKMLFLGLGTGLGSAMVVEGTRRADGAGPPALPQGQLRGLCRPRALERRQEEVAQAGGRCGGALECRVAARRSGARRRQRRRLKQLPPHCRAGGNAKAFEGGFRLWAAGGHADLAQAAPQGGED